MKITYELDDQQDDLQSIKVMHLASKSFYLLHEIDQDIRSLLKYGDVDSYEGDTIESLTKKNSELIKRMDSIRDSIYQLIGD